MKKLIIAVSLVLFPILMHAQVQWAKHIWSDNFDGVHRLVSDNQNNYYTAQGFGGYKCYYENDSLIATGSGDNFLAKCNSTGDVLWVTQFKTTNSPSCLESIPALIVDTINSAVYTGLVFCGTIILNTDTFIASTGINDYLIVKLDFSGNVVWAKQGYGIGTDVCWAGTVDSNGNTYYYCGSSLGGDFDTITFLPGGYFITLDPDGNLINYKHICDYASGISDRPTYNIGNLKVENNYIYALGSTANDTLEIDTINVQTPDSTGPIFAQFSLLGDVQWIEKIGFPASEFNWFDMDALGNFYLCGTMYADSALFGNQYLSNNGQSDVVILKYDTNFNFIWSSQTHASGGSIGTDIEVDNSFGIYVAGLFYTGSAQFGPYLINTSNAHDMFVARFDSSGGCVGVKNFGRAYGGPLTIDDQGAVVVGGTFLGNVQIGNNNFTSMGYYDSYLVKYDEITGLEGNERMANNKLIIYANPNSGKCNITIPDDLRNEKNLILSIYDSIGKLIQQTKLIIQDETIKVNIESEANGVYNVILSNGTKNYQGKIIFE